MTNDEIRIHERNAMNASELINNAAGIANAAAAIPTPISPELAIAGTLLGWIGGIISRHAAGQAPTQDEVALLQALQATLDLARAENDTSDLAAASERANEGK
jgi:hypothetical protein